MRVTFICLEWPHSGHVGGVGRYAYRLATSLAADPDIELTVVTFEGGAALDGAALRYLPRPAGRFGRFYGAPLRLRKIVAATRPDVIHSFGDEWALAAHAGVPLVRTFLGSSLSEARSSTGLRRLNHYVLALTEQLSAHRADHRIGIGPDSFEAFRCEDLMPPVTAIPPRGHARKSNSPSVVFIGSYGGRKRGALVAEVVAEAQAQLGIEIRLTVVGPESDSASWPAGTVHKSGATDDVVQEVVETAWVLVAPSLYEGFGIPTFEALSLGTAVIASSNPGSRYMLRATEESGALSVVEDKRLVPELIARLLHGPNLSSAEDVGRRRAVDALLNAASSLRLTNDIYPRSIAEAAN